MNIDPRQDLLLYYSRYHAPGVVDLSSSNAAARPLDVARLGRLEPEELAYVPPSGAPALREAIARRYESVAPGEILLSAGASEALAELALALAGPGERVVVDRGTYPSFVQAVKTAGAQVVCGSQPAPGVKLAAVCNPTVPDGRLRDVDAYLAAAESVGARAVFDEVYRDLVHDGDPASAAVERSRTAVSVGGLSKPLGLGGLRLGWIACHDRELLAALDRQLQLLSGGPASLSVVAAAAAFEQYDACVAGTLAEVRCRAPKVFAVLDAAGWTYERPAAGLTLEARAPGPVTPAGEQRVRQAGYFLIPCEMYGAPGAYRISLLADPGALCAVLALLTEPFPATG